MRGAKHYAYHHDLNYEPSPLERPPWHELAACRGVGTEYFFVEGDSGGQPLQAAWLLCEVCPVDRQCLASTIRAEGSQGRDTRTGLFAFSTPSERWKIVNRLELSNSQQHCGTVRGWQKHKLHGEAPCSACERRWRAYTDEAEIPVAIRTAAWRARKRLQTQRSA